MSKKYGAKRGLGKDGNDVVIDFSGKEVIVTGASEEGARIFFEELLKPMIDEYIEAKLDELCPTLEELSDKEFLKKYPHGKLTPN